MAVDSTIFPYLKTDFHSPRKRRLLYLGSDTPNKNLKLMVQIKRAFPHVDLYWYGGYKDHPLARLPGVHTTGWITLDRVAGETICANTDIILSTSDSDANPTTLLEGAAWGLIPACTKESGYYNDPMFTELSLDDLDYNIKTITSLLSIPSAVLKTRSLTSRKQIEDKYNWDNFCNRVWTELCSYL
jgi:glycosyltransferase involved in cell wall biosynthesis